MSNEHVREWVAVLSIVFHSDNRRINVKEVMDWAMGKSRSHQGSGVVKAPPLRMFDFVPDGLVEKRTAAAMKRFGRTASLKYMTDRNREGVKIDGTAKATREFCQGHLVEALGLLVTAGLLYRTTGMTRWVVEMDPVDHPFGPKGLVLHEDGHSQVKEQRGLHDDFIMPGNRRSFQAEHKCIQARRQKLKDRLERIERGDCWEQEREARAGLIEWNNSGGAAAMFRLQCMGLQVIDGAKAMRSYFQEDEFLAGREAVKVFDDWLSEGKGWAEAGGDARALASLAAIGERRRLLDNEANFDGLQGIKERRDLAKEDGIAPDPIADHPTDALIGRGGFGGTHWNGFIQKHKDHNEIIERRMADGIHVLPQGVDLLEEIKSDPRRNDAYKRSLKRLPRKVVWGSATLDEGKRKGGEDV